MFQEAHFHHFPYEEDLRMHLLFYRSWKLLSHLICLDASLMVLGNLLIMVLQYCLRLIWIFLVSYFSLQTTLTAVFVIASFSGHKLASDSLIRRIWEPLNHPFLETVYHVINLWGLMIFQEVLSTPVREPIQKRWFRQEYPPLMWWTQLHKSKKILCSLLLGFHTMRLLLRYVVKLVLLISFIFWKMCHF